MATVADFIRRGLRAAQPAASASNVGMLYYVTDEGVTERSSGTVWQTFSDLGSPGITQLTGNVTAGPGGGSQVATIANDAVTYAKMQNISATARVLGRKTAGAGDPEELTLSEVLDLITSAAQGDILYRGAATWARLVAGSSGLFLKTLGAGANPIWAAAAAAGLASPRYDWWLHAAVYSNCSQGGCAIGQFLTYQGSGDSQLNDNDGAWRRATTAASVSSVARTGSGVSYTRTRMNPTIVSTIRTGADITNVRIYVGLYFQNGFSVLSDNPTGPYAMFRYSTDATDPGWVGVTRDSGAQSVSANVANIAASTNYTLRMRVAANGTSIYFSVDGGAEVLINSNTPVNTQDFYLLTSVESRSASAHILDMMSMAIYHPTPNPAMGIF